MRRGAGLALVATCVLTPATVLAQSAQDKADAEVLFNAGKTALAAGNYTEACPKFAESQKKDPAIGTALYLAECYEKSGKVASAWAEFRQAEDMANQRHDTRASLATQRADRLSPSKLTIVLAPGAGDVSGLEVKRDGETVGRALLGLASAIDGGHHVVVASAPGKRSFEWSGDVPESRGAITVTIPKLVDDAHQTPTVTPTATATIPTTPTATATIAPTIAPTTTANPDTGGGLGGGKIAGIVIGAAGIVAMGLSPVLGAVAKSNYDATTTNNNCTPNGCPDQAGVDARNSAKFLADFGTGLFIGGAVALVGGVVLFFVSPKAHAASASAFVTPFFSPSGGGAALTGRF